MNDHDRYERARQRVQQIKEFYTHLTAYILVNALLIAISVLNGEYWFFWPLFGWGIGVVAHAINVFGFSQWFGNSWEEREIRRLMEREEQHR